MKSIRKAGVESGRKGKLSRRWTFAILVLVGVFLLAGLCYLSYLGGRIGVRHTGQLAAIYEIENQLTQAHLWLAEERIGEKPDSLIGYSRSWISTSTPIRLLLGGEC